MDALIAASGWLLTAMGSTAGVSLLVIAGMVLAPMPSDLAHLPGEVDEEALR